MEVLTVYMVSAMLHCNAFCRFNLIGSEVSHCESNVSI